MSSPSRSRAKTATCWRAFPDVYDPPTSDRTVPAPTPPRAATRLDGTGCHRRGAAHLRTWPANTPPAAAPANNLPWRPTKSSAFDGGSCPRPERAAPATAWTRARRAVAEDGDAPQQRDYQIAARLAARLGHARVAAADDHTGDNIAIDDEGLEVAIRAAWGRGPCAPKATCEREEAPSALATCSPCTVTDQPARRAAPGHQSDFGAPRSGTPRCSTTTAPCQPGWRRPAHGVERCAPPCDRPGARVLAIVAARTNLVRHPAGPDAGRGRWTTEGLGPCPGPRSPPRNQAAARRGAASPKQARHVGILVCPQRVHPGLEAHAIGPVALAAAAEELLRDRPRAYRHAHLGTRSAKRSSRVGTPPG